MGGGLMKFTCSIISTATKSTWNRSIKHKRTSSNSLNGYELRAFRFTWLKSTTYRLRLTLLWMYSTPPPESRQEIIRAQGAWNPNHNSHTILHEDLAQCPLPHTIACFSQFFLELSPNSSSFWSRELLLRHLGSHARVLLLRHILFTFHLADSPSESLSNSSVFSSFSYFLPLGVYHFLCDLKENSFFTTVICSYLCPVDPHFDWGREICRLLRSFSFSCLTFSPSQWELFDYIDPRCGSLLLILNLHLITWMRPGWSCSSLELLMLVSAAPTRPGPALDGHRIPLPPSLRLEPPSPLEPAAAFSGS